MLLKSLDNPSAGSTFHSHSICSTVTGGLPGGIIQPRQAASRLINVFFLYTLGDVKITVTLINSNQGSAGLISSPPYRHTPGSWRNGDLLESDRTGWQPAHGASRERFSLICPGDSMRRPMVSCRTYELKEPCIIFDGVSPPY